MNESQRETVEAVNAGLAVALEGARRALRGEAVFAVAEVRHLSALLGAMVPVTPLFAELRRLRPEMAAPLDHYKSQLDELAVILRGVRLMLLAQRTQMEAHRAQLAAVRQWADTALQTWEPRLR
ncbi:MAG: hypothetical protein ABSG69_11935 [Candidatus Acidiferrum sp.]|jgi:hypothetical protein